MLKDKVVVISGGAGLIGTELTKKILGSGASVVIGDFNKAEGTKLQSELSKKFGPAKVKYIEIDITSKDSIDNLINETHNVFNKIDGWINCAYPRNKNYGRDFLEVEFDDFNSNTNMHLGGYFLTCQRIIKYYIQQGYGNIINFSSIYGVVPPKFEIYEGTNLKNSVEYSVIKSGIIHFSKYAAKYLKNKNVRINVVSPGGILDRQPETFLKNYKSFCLNKGMLDREDISGTIIFLLSDESRFINGQNLIIDDGFTL